MSSKHLTRKHRTEGASERSGRILEAALYLRRAAAAAEAAILEDATDAMSEAALASALAQADEARTHLEAAAAHRWPYLEHAPESEEPIEVEP